MAEPSGQARETALRSPAKGLTQPCSIPGPGVVARAQGSWMPASSCLGSAKGGCHRGPRLGGFADAAATARMRVLAEGCLLGHLRA